MIDTLKKGATPKTLQRLTTALAERRYTAKKSIKKYCGVINLKEDPQVIQKKMRDEWR